jgi:hypothetical protein
MTNEWVRKELIHVSLQQQLELPLSTISKLPSKPPSPHYQIDLLFSHWLFVLPCEVSRSK